MATTLKTAVHKLAHSALWLCLLVLPLQARSAEALSIELESGVEIPITQYGQGSDRLLWLPSGQGISQRMQNLAEATSQQDMQLWLADLHSGYFLPHGRSSLLQIPLHDIVELIEKSQPQDGRTLYLISSGRGAALTLLALQQLSGKLPVQGLILISPNLMVSSPQPGKDAEYLSVIDHTRLPIFIIQPESSAKRWYLGDLAERLNAAGSQVYVQIIQDVADGYHADPDASSNEQAKARELPAVIKQAARLLADIQLTGNSVVQPDAEPTSDWKISPPRELPAAMPDKPIAAELHLRDLQQQEYRLDDYRGKIVMLNFWTTWCPPCVEEIPALGRLNKRMQQEQDFKLLSVDVAESEQRIKDFLSKIPANYPVLLDPEGDTVRPWKLQAFPTTFIIDRSGRIRYSYFGGLDWDRNEIMVMLQQLLDEKTPEPPHGTNH